MTFEAAAVRDAEGVVLDLVRRLTLPEDRECLYCYVARMLGEHGCDNGLRWAGRYRDIRAPRATALEERMGRMGGFCDCEIFLNGVQLHPASRVRVDDEGGPARSRRPACAGVRRGSTQGCAHWVRQRRDRYGAYDDDF